MFWVVQDDVHHRFFLCTFYTPKFTAVNLTHSEPVQTVPDSTRAFYPCYFIFEPRLIISVDFYRVEIFIMIKYLYLPSVRYFRHYGP